MMNRREFILASTAAAAAPALQGCSRPETMVIQGLPVSKFGKKPTAEKVTEGIDLTGKTAVVTGCNSGLGLETLRVLALRGAHVFGTGRTMEKAQIACESVHGNTTPVVLELSDLQSCVDCAKTIQKQTEKVDMMVGNAGIIGGPDLELVNGVEKTFAVNHLGHFLLINRLLGRIQAAEQGRVVMVSSGAAYGSVPDGGIDFDNLDGHKGYSGFKFYGQSKLANTLFALELAERLQGTRATANSIAPGFVKTNIGRNGNRFMRVMMDLMGSLFGRTTAEGAATQCYVATSPKLDKVSGYFFEDCNPIKITGGAGYLYDKELARKLWQVSEDLTKDYLFPG
jgi:NAD(P)-dependent dehydrogenase (short-subunit alcohol dehydrogenase family)